MKSHAVVFPEANRVEFQEIECPEPGPGDLVVRLTHSWISNGTEGSYLRGERIAGDTPVRPGDPAPFPVVPGYQKVGRVQRVGRDVTDVAEGEVVFAAMSRVSGMFWDTGGHVSPAVTPRDHIWKLPSRADPLAFAGLVLTQVGYNCGTRAPIRPGEAAVVVGDGLVGQWAAQTLAWRGAEVLLVGRHEDRLARFSREPYRRVVNARHTDWPALARDLFPNGVRVGVDTVGSIPAVEALHKLMARYGHIVSAGFYGTQDRLAVQPLRTGEVSLDIVSGWAQDRMDDTLRLVADGYLETLPLITHHFPASDALRAWDLIRAKRDKVLGVILDWP